ncbi:RuvC-like resolvase [Mycobacterium phage Donny]|uniref:RuvC-like resolvase n=2 Tax=Acadianvirus acadian TaxID=1982901 RepID=A0A7M1CM74_9CAUD|nr:RuvC-like resolvase [Mycobacterium phage Donny]QOP65550.1 RuvC-like resolvase [Mycobacterium phage Suigeneris]WUT94778.1 RuvC-like resolvase [Mycobacterium phage PRodriguez]
MRILGIDTSLTATGLARIDVVPIEEDDNPLAAYVAVVGKVGAPKPTKDKSKRAMARRVNALIEQIEWCFEGDEKPDAVGMESLAFGARGEGAWVLPWIFGRVIELCEKHDVPLQVVATSARAKFATGKGNASKDQVLAAVIKLFPEADVSDNNEADALAVAAVLCQLHGLPILPVTQYRLDVIAGLGD